VSREETWAIVVAAGSGDRLGGDRPKAFVRFGERTLLAASLETLEEHEGIDGLVVVVPEGWEERTSLLVEDLCASKVAAAVAGGRSRPDSVAAGLAELPDRCSRVLVHDAARPLVDHALIDRVLAALDGGAEAVVPALDIPDTVKRVDGDGAVVETLVRAELRAVQTPQGFGRELLDRAYAQDRSGATDCASLAERAGARVLVVPGDPRNLKVTTSDDLQRAEALYRQS
jgi:2-C-methyl-D-erythritol 4-phosphate cytidylyltransferase